MPDAHIGRELRKALDRQAASVDVTQRETLWHRFESESTNMRRKR